MDEKNKEYYFIIEKEIELEIIMKNVNDEEIKIKYEEFPLISVVSNSSGIKTTTDHFCSSYGEPDGYRRKTALFPP